MRAYRSPLREERAAQSRRRISDSARALFAERGFAGTTIAAIAERAGVSPQTVYATFGSKAAVMEALLTGMEEAADAARWRATLAETTEPGALLDAFAGWTASVLGTSKELLAAAATAVGDPGLADLAARGDEHRRAALVPLVDRLHEGGALARGLTVEQAVDRAWLVTGVELFLGATDRCGWDVEEYASWLARLLRQQLLAHPDS